MKIIAIIIISVLALSSCTNVPTQSSYQVESNKLESNQEQIIKTSPVPQITDSLERKNVAKRAEIFNKSDKLSYIYLVSYGKIISFHTVKWKISSVSSYLTPQEKLVDYKGRNCWDWNSGTTCYTVQSPDIDGSYGTNWDAIFFFTTEWAYVEWKWEYLVSDFPLRIVDTPSLVREVK